VECAEKQGGERSEKKEPEKTKEKGYWRRLSETFRRTRRGKNKVTLSEGQANEKKRRIKKSGEWKGRDSYKAHIPRWRSRREEREKKKTIYDMQFMR